VGSVEPAFDVVDIDVTAEGHEGEGVGVDREGARERRGVDNPVANKEESGDEGSDTHLE
jgi:hypothetical protein